MLDASPDGWPSRNGRGARGQLQETQWLPKARLVERQNASLEPLLNHCASASSWFSHRLRQLGVTKQSLCDLNVFQRLPPITKRDIQDAGQNLFCTNLPRGHGHPTRIKTSGSTGEPTLINRSYLNELDWMALALREDDWHRRDYARRECTISTITKNLLRCLIGERQSICYSQARLLFACLCRGICQNWLVRFKNIARLIFECFQVYWLALRDHSKELRDGLREIRVYGETFCPESRRNAGDALCVRITDMYCSQEVGIIACQCPEFQYLHVSAEALIVEVIRDDGSPCLPGEIGRVVITDLRNFATPLIRYEIGDYAEVGPQCPCGRGAPTISQVLGRRRNLMLLPDGSRCWPRLGHLFREYSKMVAVKQFQLIQTDVGKLQVRLVVASVPRREHEELLKALLLTMTGHDFELEFVYFSDKVPRERGSKFEDFKNLVDRD